ncbi:MAG: hypothetical protein JWO32_2863 [Bacteroidetes bacterium]|nr:hypothetical protein [Bacteroidota bacterium]
MGNVKKYEIYVDDELEYKLKGHLFYHSNKIANLQDSVIVFENDSVIRLNQIKAIRIHTGGHLGKTFQELFFIAGIGFIALNTTNNAINDSSPLIDDRAVYISGALVGTSILMRVLLTRHIRINKTVTLRVNAIDYSKLNEK